jgi:hypothetical protein
MHPPQKPQLVITNRDVIFSKDTLLSDGGFSSTGQLHSPPIDPGEFYFLVPESSSPQIEPTHSLPLNKKEGFKTDESTHAPPEPPNQDPPKTPPPPDDEDPLTIPPTSAHQRSHLHQAQSSSPPHLRRSTRSTKGQRYTPRFYDTKLYSFGFLAEPLTVPEALSSDHSKDWKDAMDKVYNSLINNRTWDLVDPPPNQSIISTKWIFRQKYNSDGSLSHFKARFVALSTSMN